MTSPSMAFKQQVADIVSAANEVGLGGLRLAQGWWGDNKCELFSMAFKQQVDEVVAVTM